MKKKYGDLDELMDKMGGESFNIFSDMVSLILSGGWGDRMNQDGIYPGDPDFDELVGKYLRAIRRRNHADAYLQKPVNDLKIDF